MLLRKAGVAMSYISMVDHEIRETLLHDLVGVAASALVVNGQSKALRGRIPLGVSSHVFVLVLLWLPPHVDRRGRDACISTGGVVGRGCLERRGGRGRALVDTPYHTAHPEHGARVLRGAVLNGL